MHWSSATRSRSTVGWLCVEMEGLSTGYTMCYVLLCVVLTHACDIREEKLVRPKAVIAVTKPSTSVVSRSPDRGYTTLVVQFSHFRESFHFGIEP